MLSRRALSAVVLLAALGVACNDGGAGQQSATAGAQTKPLPSGRITVFAASSLTDAFNEVGRAFEAGHPGVSVEFNFAGSPALRTQLQQGATADVLATADQANMATALQDKLVVDGGKTFAKNRLAVIIPKSNPADIASPFELAQAGLKIVLAGADVPAGKYARQVIEKMASRSQAVDGFAGKVLGNVVSEEPNVKAVVAKVQLGEADAGIAYVTDVTPDVAKDVTMIAIPDDVNIVAEYPIAVTSNAGQPEIALAFIAFSLSPDGQAVLRRYGFIGAP